MVAPKIRGTYEEENKLKIIVTTSVRSYKLYENILTEVGGRNVSSSITCIKSPTGNYVPEKYVISLDGAYYGKSVNDFYTMPVSGKPIEGLADKIISEHTDMSELTKSNLIKHLNLNNQKNSIQTTYYNVIAYCF